MYHLVFPGKYRRAIFVEPVDEMLKEACLGIEQRYQVEFLEIGTDKDHVHFLVQSVPTYSVTDEGGDVDKALNGAIPSGTVDTEALAGSFRMTK